MKKLFLLLFLSALLSFGQSSTITVLPLNMNTPTLSMFQSMGLAASNAKPNVQVMIINTAPAADGYRVSIACQRADGTAYSSSADTPSSGMGAFQIFYVDCASIGPVSVIPYKLSGVAVTAH